MSEIVPLNTCSLSFKCAGSRHILEFDEEYLTCSSQQWMTSQTQKILLRRIIPEFSVDRSSSTEEKTNARIFLFCLVSAVVVYFSDIQTHVPLLAPTLLFVAAYGFYRLFRSASPLEKTKFVSEFGESLLVIPHLDEINTQRQKFEAGLLEAIRQARQRHYGET